MEGSQRETGRVQGSPMFGTFCSSLESPTRRHQQKRGDRSHAAHHSVEKPFKVTMSHCNVCPFRNGEYKGLSQNRRTPKKGVAFPFKAATKACPPNERPVTCAKISALSPPPSPGPPRKPNTPKRTHTHTKNKMNTHTHTHSRSRVRAAKGPGRRAPAGSRRPGGPRPR